jgi:hypothetical protein
MKKKEEDKQALYRDDCIDVFVVVDDDDGL